MQSDEALDEMQPDSEAALPVVAAGIDPPARSELRRIRKHVAEHLGEPAVLQAVYPVRLYACYAPCPTEMAIRSSPHTIFPG